jgi:hypothetical protein
MRTRWPTGFVFLIPWLYCVFQYVIIVLFFGQSFSTIHASASQTGWQSLIDGNLQDKTGGMVFAALSFSMSIATISRPTQTVEDSSA